MNAITENGYTEIWRSLASQIGKPKNVLCISAHWVTDGTRICPDNPPKTIHDFYGFPEALSNLEYPAPGAPELTSVVRQLIPHVTPTTWGLDHGAWSILVKMYPEADVPVAQLSLAGELDARGHFELGRKLAPLREQGVLIIGSGNIVHNLRSIRPGADAYDWSREFDDAIAAALVKGDDEALIDYHELGLAAARAVPTPEHYWPLLYIAGMRQAEEKAVFFNEGFDYGSISMRSVAFGL